MHFNRYLIPYVKHWLPDRMVFVGGPRQVGKTSLSKGLLRSEEDYLTWDSLEDQKKIKSHAFKDLGPLVALDEIHKYPRWRTLLKGHFDKFKTDQKIIVTGSARLDLFRKGGDSLFGRYHYLRLHPLTVSELEKLGIKWSLDQLYKYGGFPEPFLKKDEVFLKIWQRERSARVIREDLRDLTNLKDYNQIQLLADLLPEKVGSLLSLQSISEDLEKSPHTIDRWIEILESVYLCYRIAPYVAPKIKAIKKQNKLYLWDWSTIENPGARFENLVAGHLLKYCHFLEDTAGEKMELRFIRDQYNHEIDFVVLKNKKPLFAVECKTGEKQLSSNIDFFKKRLSIPKYYQVHLGTRSYSPKPDIHVVPFVEFCRLEKLA